MKKLCSVFLTLVMLLGIVLPCLTLETTAAPIEYYEATKDFQGLKLSVIGDSISTFEGVTNSSTYNPLYLSTSEATFGTYYGDSARTDYDQFSWVTRADTWWQQTVDTLGMELLVNNAWSGSYLVKDNARGNTTEYPAAGYKNRAVNLHIGSEKPDIIAVYLGTNDIGSSSTVGSKADVDTASERSALYTSVNSYATPTTSVQAYYIMISRMLATYPDAEIYCMTPTIALSMTDTRQTSTDNFNNGVRYLVDYWQGQGKNVFLVDLDQNSGLNSNDNVKDYYYANNVHPDCAGMDWITTCLISEIMEHSTKGIGESTFHEVSYNLTDCFAKAGLPRRATEGQPLEVNLLPYITGQEIEVTVTMKDANGNTVSIPGGGVRGHSVYIPEVTGPITVTAKVVHTNNFYWQATSEAFSSSTGVGFDYNTNTLVSGTYTGSTDSGAFTDIQYSLTQPVVLEYDRPWVLEYKGGGGTYAGGIMLMNNTADSATTGNMYIHITQTNVLFGYRDSNGYNNSGIPWETIATKMGSTAGADYRKETHVFRFVNVPNGTNNKIYLYVDGVQIGSMDTVKMIGTSTTASAVSGINISGKDFVFNYLGSSNHPIRNCSVSYIKVWENGQETVDTSALENYRWELNEDKDAFVTLDNSTFTENELRMQAGSISNGTFTNTYFEIDKQVILMHNQPWNLEWVSSGEWYDVRNGAMLLCSSNGSNDLNAFYLYRRSGSTFVALGERKNGVHNNYGVGLSANGIDGTARHKYNLVNEVTTDASGTYSTNMVYLYVDDVKIGPMTTYYQGGTDTGETSNWVVGKDFTFSYVGNETFSVGDCDLEYLQVTVPCNHNYEAAVTAPTCTADGYTTYTCSKCGDSYTDSVVSATGHSWVDATCTAAMICSICGTTEGSATGHSYVGGTCSVCGAEDPNYAPDYYLIGYINGANYGCEEDYANLGEYKFVNGQVVVTFDVDSYVFVKTGDNVNWFMFLSYVDTTSGTLYNTSTGTAEKMLVPGGVEVTFTLVENGDGSLTLSYEVAEEPVVVPTLTLSYPTLAFEDEILYNAYFSVSDTSSVVEMGMITFASRLTDGTIADAVNVISGYTTSGSNYIVHSNGVPAKNLGDALYFKVYAKLTDGSYVYTDVAGYNAVAYANTILNSASSSAKAKSLVVAMLNYGAAAQVQFGYNTDNLMNASLTAEQLALVDAYDESMVDAVVKADSAKVGLFVHNGGYTKVYPTVSFEGAFSINYYFATANTPDAAPVFYYWDAETYANATELTAENATGTISMTLDGDQWFGTVSGIAAKEIDQTYYTAGVYYVGDTAYYSPVVSYSLGNYCETLAAQDNAFGAATAVYGYYAKAYFA